MAQARTRTAPKKAKTIVCEMCGQEIDDETPLEGPEGLYHAVCLKAANRLATNAKPTGKRPAPVVTDDDEEDEEDEEAEDEEDEELEDEEPVEPSDEDEDDDEEGDDEDEEDEESEDDEEAEEEDEEDEDEEPAPKPRAKAPPAKAVAPAKGSQAAKDRMAAVRAARKPAAVEEYDEEDEPAPKKAAAKATAGTKAPSKPKVEVRIPSNVELRFVDNPARAGTKRWAVLEALARVRKEDMDNSTGPGSVAGLHKVATRLMAQVAKANPSNEPLQDPKNQDTKSLNIPWFATDKGKADIFKNGASGWGISHDPEHDTYRIFKRAKAK